MAVYWYTVCGATLTKAWFRQLEHDRIGDEQSSESSDVFNVLTPSCYL